MNRALLIAALLLDVVTVGGRGGSSSVPRAFLLGQGAPGTTTSGVTEEVLATIPIPAGKVSVDGATILGTLAMHGLGANTTLRVRMGGIGGTIVYDSGSAPTGPSDIGSIEMIQQRSSASTATAQGKLIVGLADKTPGTGGPSFWSNRTATITWANQLDLVITATSTVAGSVVLDSYQFVLYQ